MFYIYTLNMSEMGRCKTNLRFRLIQDRKGLYPSSTQMVFYTQPHWLITISYISKDPALPDPPTATTENWWAVIPMNADSQTYILDYMNA